MRDALAGLPSSQDWDICAPADAEHFSALAQESGFTVNGVYRNTGTVNLTDGERKYEFTSFRTDVYRRGEHAPSKVTFTKDIATDARRRDFKCNAVYYDVAKETIEDPLGGVKDIEQRSLSTTREADEVFSEDGLRLMRLARQAAQTGFVPTLECIFGAKFNAALIAKISPERIYAELQLILHADEKYGRQYAHYEGLKLLEGTEVLNYILPSLRRGKVCRKGKTSTTTTCWNIPCAPANIRTDRCGFLPCCTTWESPPSTMPKGITTDTTRREKNWRGTSSNG